MRYSAEATKSLSHLTMLSETGCARFRLLQRGATIGCARFRLLQLPLIIVSVRFDDDPRFASISNKAAELAKTLMAALYRIPCKPVISFDENPAVSEEAVLAIWGQQWARLRRSFRFCTLALSDRSTKDSTFDLQLIPAAMPSAKSRFNGAVEAHKTDREPDWLCVAVDELTTPRPDGLRQFDNQTGA